MNLYADDEQVAKTTAAAIGLGHAIFQIFKVGDDHAHVRHLLEMFDPPRGLMLDAGCGIGRVAELMRKERPDLYCVLLNISQAQLDLCPEMEKLHGDFHSIPVPDWHFDSVMFNYSLGHGRLEEALTEAARVLRPSGILFIYDIAADDPETIYHALHYRTFPERDVILTALKCGFARSREVIDLDASPDAFMDVIDPRTFAELFKGVRPVAYRFIKQ